MLRQYALLCVLATLPIAVECSEPGHQGQCPETAQAGGIEEVIRLARQLGTPTHSEAKRTDSGLVYIDVRKGRGRSATPGRSTVWIHYSAWTDDGVEFDSSAGRGIPVRFSLETPTVIEGLREGIVGGSGLGMGVGGIRKLIVPPQLGYAERGVLPYVRANATLILEVHLLAVQAEEYPSQVRGPLFHSEYISTSVTRAALEARRKKGLPSSDQFFAQGTLGRVDQRLGRWTTLTAGGEGLSGIGPGAATFYYCYGVEDHVYEDASGVRLIASDRIAMDTLTLSRASKIQGYPIPLDVDSLKTESGIGLGDSQERVKQSAGEPSIRDRCGGYEIWWYLEKPKQHATFGERPFLSGNVAAYAFEDSTLVEIWLHAWDTEPRG